MSLKTSFVVACVCVVTIMFLSCVDVPSTGPEFPDFRSQTRFINAAVEVGTVDLLLEPTSGAGLSSFATINFQDDTGYMDVAAGSRKMAIQVGGANVDADITSLGIASDGKVTILILPKSQPVETNLWCACFHEPVSKLIPQQSLFLSF